MIGILDWGIGGMGVYRLLRQRHPRLPIVYCSDTGSRPYGEVPARSLRRRLVSVASVLAARGVTHLVVACNAASTVLDGHGIRTPHGGLHVTGVIEPAVRLIRRLSPRRLGIVGGRRTIRSLCYRRALARPGRVVIQRVAQPLSALIESGEGSESPALVATIERIVAPLRNCDTLLLACTHYAAVAPAFARLLPGIRLVDPAPELLDWIEERGFPDRASSAHAEPVERFLTTGDGAAMARAAQGAFGVVLDRAKIERIRVLA